MTIAQGTILSERVRSAMRNVIGFPHPTSKQFCDISPVAEGDPALFRAVIDAMAKFCEEVLRPTASFASSRGATFLTPLSRTFSVVGCVSRVGPGSCRVRPSSRRRDVLCAEQSLGDPGRGDQT